MRHLNIVVISSLIINESLRTEFFPNEWKTTIVIPITKKIIKKLTNTEKLPIDGKVIVKNQLVK